MNWLSAEGDLSLPSPEYRFGLLMPLSLESSEDMLESESESDELGSSSGGSSGSFLVEAG